MITRLITGGHNVMIVFFRVCNHENINGRNTKHRPVVTTQNTDEDYLICMCVIILYYIVTKIITSLVVTDVKIIISDCVGCVEHIVVGLGFVSCLFPVEH